VDGLARRVGNRIEREGFALGSLATAPSQGRAESAVLYVRGAASEARLVGRSLGISQIEQADASVRGLAGDARVIVMLGADQTS
jgi:hypothetical protein